MSRYDDIECRRYVAPAPSDVDAAGTPITSILELASRLSHASNVFASTLDNRADYPATMRAARALARASDALTTAIADSVACGDNRLS